MLLKQEVAGSRFGLSGEFSHVPLCTCLFSLYTCSVALFWVFFFFILKKKIDKNSNKLTPVYTEINKCLQHFKGLVLNILMFI